MPNLHLPYGGSTAARTLACPAWRTLADKMPERKAGPAADHGNLLHDVAEEYYRNNVAPADLVGIQTYNGQTLTQADVDDLVVPAINALEKVLDEYRVDDLLIEQFMEIVPGLVGGSADIIGLSEDRKTMLLSDWKFGAQPVRAEDNPALKFYALAAMIDPKTRHLFTEVERVVYCIVQPKVYDDAQIWEDVAELDDFRDQLLAAVEDSTTFNAGSHCRFCPGAPICQASKQAATAALALNPTTSEQVAEALTLANQLEAWAKQVKEQAEDLAQTGATIPGYKLVRGKSQRKYTELAETRLPELLGDDAYEQKLIGITKAEKLLGKGKLEELELAEKPEGKLTIAPESDKRAAVVIDGNKILKKLFDKD